MADYSGCLPSVPATVGTSELALPFVRFPTQGERTMTIDWLSFTPWSAAVGGAILGLGTAILLLVNGRTAGVSAIIGGVLRPNLAELPWRAAFLLGLVIAPSLYGAFQYLPDIVIRAEYSTLIVAGLLVGVGTRYGAGCTSGHGICGLSRLSARSLIATVAFMAAGFATVFVVRHVIGG
ncbi:MAG: YeeE/YedE family protein [Betaproteobacteria bacterium]